MNLNVSTQIRLDGLRYHLEVCFKSSLRSWSLRWEIKRNLMPVRGNRWKIIEMSFDTHDYKIMGYDISLCFSQYRRDEKYMPVEICREMWEDLVFMGFKQV
jgi:hypothetical protein